MQLYQQNIRYPFAFVKASIGRVFPFLHIILVWKDLYIKKLIKISLLQWNNHGYDVAKIFSPKFDVISPIWLQLHRTGEESYKLGGEHDVDVNWLKDVRKAGQKGQKSKFEFDNLPT